MKDEEHKVLHQKYNISEIDSLKCHICGKFAIGYNIFGAFCSHEHYPTAKTSKNKVIINDEFISFTI